MDKVKVVLALLKKHHFWVMTAAVVLLSFIGWFLATSKLWAGYKESSSKINKKFDDLTKINSSERENEKWIEGLKAETDKLKVKVAIAWEKAYLEQKNHVLKWPPQLGETRVKKLEALGPGDPIDQGIRKFYQNYIGREFPKLLKIVDAHHYRADKMSEEELKRAGDHGPDHEYKVFWNAANQGEIEGMLSLSKPPESNEMRDLQEDLWVYQALLTIIGKLNERANGNYNAKVKEIQDLLIGRRAAEVFKEGMAEGRIAKVDSDAPSAGSPAPDNSAAERYVKVKPASSAAAGEPGVPAPPPAEGAAGVLPEFKCMPVVMRLLMDQREISSLLVECANSPLPVEVRQFRLRPRGGSFAVGQVKTTGSTTNRKSDKEQISFDVWVEIQGVIYIFNPPDRARLGTVAVAEAEEETTQEGTSEKEARNAAEGAGAGPPAGRETAAAASPPAEEPASGEQPGDESEENATSENDAAMESN